MKICTLVNPELSRVLQEYAFKKDITWSHGKEVRFTDAKYLFMVLEEERIPGNGHLLYSTKNNDGAKEISALEFCQMIDEIQKPFCIGLHKVVKVDNGVKVGCQFVSDKEIKKIYDMRFPNE